MLHCFKIVSNRLETTVCVAVSVSVVDDEFNHLWVTQLNKHTTHATVLRVRQLFSAYKGVSVLRNDYDSSASQFRLLTARAQCRRIINYLVDIAAAATWHLIRLRHCAYFSISFLVQNRHETFALTRSCLFASDALYAATHFYRNLAVCVCVCVVVIKKAGAVFWFSRHDTRQPSPDIANVFAVSSVTFYARDSCLEDSVRNMYAITVNSFTMFEVDIRLSPDIKVFLKFYFIWSYTLMF